MMISLRCLFGRHHRDWHKAVEGHPYDYSVCKHCGTPMIKDLRGWRRLRSSDPVQQTRVQAQPPDIRSEVAPSTLVCPGPRSFRGYDNLELIADHVPELAGMSHVAGMAHALKQVDGWSKSCTPDQAARFAELVRASTLLWEAEGLTMPYWCKLWLLRVYQAEVANEERAVAVRENDG